MTETVDLIVTGGTVVSSKRVRPADVAVVDGRIVRVGDLGGVTARETIDASGCFVLPGVIDAHTHPVYADDLGELSRAGAAGGVTTVISYIGALPSWGFPAGDPVAVFEEFTRRWDGNTIGDFSVHVAFIPGNDVAAFAAPLVARGVSSFKFFMAYRGRGMMADDRFLLDSLTAIGKAGGLAAIHAENGDGIEHLIRGVRSGGPVANADFLHCHRPLLECEAVLRAIALAEASDCPLYVPHVAAGDALPIVANARAQSSTPVWLETCAHYLVLDNDAVLERGALAKIAPPLRTPHDNDLLWDGLRDDDVQVVATDHAARTLAMKSEGADIFEAPYGTEGTEHLLPLLYSEGVRKRGLPIERVAAVLSENPADIFGLSPRKGRVVEGADADLVVLDPDARSVCSADAHVTRADYCLYEGLGVQGGVRRTIRRGEVVATDGKVVDGAGGQFLRRAPVRRAAADGS